MMVLRRAAMLAVLIIVFGLMQTSQVAAATRDGLTLKVTCDGFISRGGAINLTRDNTGVGREQITFVATDGLGNTIFNPTSESFVVGGRLTFPVGLYFAFSAVPQANPIVVRIVSSEGNGQPEQTIYSTTGSCDNVPSVLVTEAVENLGFVILDILDGRTSATVPLNTDPPRPLNPAGLAGLNRPGYLVVNTGSLNIRSGDSHEYTIVGRVQAGTELIVHGRNKDRSWWYVQVLDVIGWVNAEHVFIRGDLTNIPEVPVQGEIARPTFVLFSPAVLARIPINGSLGVCDTLTPANLDFFIVGRTRPADWYELEIPCGDVTTTGWVKAEWGAVRNPSESFIPVTD